MIFCDLSRAGGWEEERLCYGDNADAPHAYRASHRIPQDWHPHLVEEGGKSEDAKDEGHHPHHR